MKKIQLVDLVSQYERISSEIDEAVLRVVRSAAFINGPEVKAFQSELEEYLDVKHVIPVANGTDALQIALMAAGLQPGDEVITPSFTYIATAEVIALLRLKPVFVEVDPDTFTIDPVHLESVITPKSKAVIPVHLYGQCADMAEILKVADKHNLFVVEDTAQGIGAKYTFPDGTVKRAGTMGHVGTTSFFPSKNLGCYGDGGAMFTNDDALAAKIRMIANHGQSKKYIHDIIGVNSRLDSIQAAILRIKLKHFDSYIAARQQAAAYYDRVLGEFDAFTPPARAEYSEHTFHQYTLKLNGVDRDGLMAHLAENDIPSNIYYPLPIHRQKAFTSLGYDPGDMSRTDALCDVVVSLPMHTELSDDQLEHISSNMIGFIEKKLINTP